MHAAELDELAANPVEAPGPPVTMQRVRRVLADPQILRITASYFLMAASRGLPACSLLPSEFAGDGWAADRRVPRGGNAECTAGAGDARNG